MSERKRVVKINHMNADLTNIVTNFAENAMKRQTTDMAIAADIKKELHNAYPDDIWQVFVGRNMASFVAYKEGKYIYFYIGQLGFCIYAA